MAENKFPPFVPENARHFSLIIFAGLRWPVVKISGVVSAAAA